MTYEAHKYLKVLSLLTKDCQGLLLGHIRGHRYLIERIIPIPANSEITLKKLIELDDEWEHGLIGFFTFEPGQEPWAMIHTPLAMGKVLLKIKIDPEGGLDFALFRIEYTSDYILTVLNLISEEPGI